MRIRLYALLLFLCSCSSAPQDKPADTADIDSVSIIDTTAPEVSPCNIVYDTISNPAYKMHKLIMDRYFIPEKRGYWMTSTGDTLSTFLYPQDIGVFLQELDSTEQGVYRLLTNKIIFRILNHDSRQFIFSPEGETRNYFLWHVAHPMCSELPIDSTIAIVERDMPAKTSGNTSFKAEVLKNLNEAK